MNLQDIFFWTLTNNVGIQKVNSVGIHLLKQISSWKVHSLHSDILQKHQPPAETGRVITRCPTSQLERKQLGADWDATCGLAWKKTKSGGSKLKNWHLILMCRIKIQDLGVVSVLPTTRLYLCTVNVPLLYNLLVWQMSLKPNTLRHVADLQQFEMIRWRVSTDKLFAMEKLEQTCRLWLLFIRSQPELNS